MINLAFLLLFIPPIGTQIGPAPPEAFVTRDLTAAETDQAAMLIIAECGVFDQVDEQLFEDCGLSVLGNVQLRVESPRWPSTWFEVVCDGEGDHWEYPCWAARGVCPEVVQLCPSQAYSLHRAAYQVVAAWEDGRNGPCPEFEFYHSLPNFYPAGEACMLRSSEGIFVQFYNRPN